MAPRNKRALPAGLTEEALDQLVDGVRTQLPGFDQKVLSLYARGLTVRELQAHHEECYAVPVSADVITAVTDELLQEVKAWQQRPLEPVYIAVAFDTLIALIDGLAGFPAAITAVFPETVIHQTDEAAGKLLYLALQHVIVGLGAPKEWRVAMQHITLLFGDRVPMAE